MKILLIMESPVIKQNYVNSLPPLGILYISSFLESKQIPNDVIDCNVSRLDMSSIQNYDAIGFSVNSSNIIQSLKTAETIKQKKPSIQIIFGGPQVLSDPVFFIQKEFVDAAVVGEGEHALYEYLTHNDPTTVKGLYLKNPDKKNEIFFTGQREWLDDLDSLPFPALDKVDITKYNVPLKQTKPISSIMTSRGCPFGCIFCFHSLGKKWRFRSAKNVVDEIEWQVKKLGVKEICIEDDNVSLDTSRAEQIFEMIIDRGIKVKLQLHNGLRADRLTEELLIKMKKAGLWLFSVAPESGNPESLIKINKGFKLEAINQAIIWAKKLKLYTYAFFMLGFPWETKEDIERTIAYAKKLDTDFTQFSRVMPFKNTVLYAMMNLNEDTVTEDRGLFYGTAKYNAINEKEMSQLIKKAYRSCFLKPRVIYKLLTTISLRDLYLLTKYAVTSDSV